MLFESVIQNTKVVIHNISFTVENTCLLTWAAAVVKRKSVDRAKGQKGDIWHNRLSKTVSAQSLH